MLELLQMHIMKLHCKSYVFHTYVGELVRKWKMDRGNKKSKMIL